jgi:hypothetical protein
MPSLHHQGLTEGFALRGIGGSIGAPFVLHNIPPNYASERRRAKYFNVTSQTKTKSTLQTYMVHGS